jgi:tetratricopeptide (TPR) repeat protein
LELKQIPYKSARNSLAVPARRLGATGEDRAKLHSGRPAGCFSSRQSRDLGQGRYGVGAAKLHLGEYDDAAKWLRQSVVVNPNHSMAHFLLAAALGQLGRVKESRAEAEAGLGLNRTFTIRSFREGAESDNPVFLKQRHNIYEGLRKAGIPEG